VKAVYGERIAPWLGDLVLARNGFDAQQLDEPLVGERDGNLFESVPGDFAAHGRFDEESKSRSWLLEADLRRGPLALAALGTLAAALFARNGKD
jgi:hypothetical protein